MYSEPVLVERPQAGSSPAAFSISPVDYYYANVQDAPGAAYEILSQLEQLGVNLLAFTAVPNDNGTVQPPSFQRSPGSSSPKRGQRTWSRGPASRTARRGRRRAGALATVHERLIRAGIDVYASAGVTNGRGAFGYVVYVREDQFEHAVDALRLRCSPYSSAIEVREFPVAPPPAKEHHGRALTTDRE